MSRKPKLPQFSPNEFRLGILGGGQLARMLALKAHEMGVEVAVLSENADDPAAQVVKNWVSGNPNDAEVLRQFLASCDVATFESEFLEADLLNRLRKETGTEISPNPEIMGAIQDRLSQKALLVKNGVPTSEYFEVSTADQARVAFEKLGGRAVFKLRRFGYDGNGTFIVKSEKDLAAFLPKVSETKGGFIAESFVPFTRELAIMIVRGKDGKTIAYPFVETKQENARCLWVKGPLKPNAKLKKIESQLVKFLKKIDYVGAMGVELFETKTSLTVNELAPRVHNSGHYTLDAMSLDQFAAHVLAVIGGDLKAPVANAKGFAMLNLLGKSSRPAKWNLTPDVKLHWYGKLENRNGRKMGHLNATAATPQSALDKLLRVRKNFDV